MSSQTIASMNSDESLWRRVVAGDTSAFQSVVGKYQGAVSAIGFSILGDFSASQDIAQETFWAAWTSREHLRDSTRLGGWLCGIARNLSHDWRRRNLSRGAQPLDAVMEPIADQADPTEQSIDAEEAAIVWRSLQDLPEIYREVMALYYRQGKSATEVACALELSEDAVKQRLSRGRTLLREQVATVIEDVLVRSRPGKNFTAKVMAGIVGLAAAQTGSTAAAATTLAKALGSGTASGVAAAATKSLLASSAAGFLGGTIGALGGLGGAFLGTWLPAELAPTATERQLLTEFGRRQRHKAIIYTLAILAATGLLFLNRGWIYYFGFLMAISLIFVIDVIVQTIRVQRKVREVRETVSPEDDPNPSEIRRRLAAAMPIAGTRRWKGRSYTSALRFFGLPLLDIQIGDPVLVDNRNRKLLVARGWIAIGEQAQGVLLAIGGHARGFVAIGGLAIGAICLGGVTIGLISVGGIAIGLLSLGGCAAGYWSLAGLALGWNAAGGVALGWHSAAGGFAMAMHAATGGFAIARDYVVGQGFAAQVNTPEAQKVIANESLRWTLDWVIANMTWFMVAVFGLSFGPALLPLLMYRRNDCAEVD